MILNFLQLSLKIKTVLEEIIGKKRYIEIWELKSLKNLIYEGGLSEWFMEAVLKFECFNRNIESRIPLIR